MKTILIAVITLFVGLYIGIEGTRTDLEIYTKDNIYYVNGLEITSETGAGERKFKNKEQLKEYISNITAKQYEHNRKQ